MSFFVVMGVVVGVVGDVVRARVIVVERVRGIGLIRGDVVAAASVVVVVIVVVIVGVGVGVVDVGVGVVAVVGVVVVVVVVVLGFLELLGVLGLL